MAQLKSFFTKVILAIILISILITFCATPSSYAKLDLREGEFYYAGTQKGQYTVKEGIFSWLLSKIGDIADWLLGIITMGFRMVFVGWTALFEKLLTWALESTAGVNASGEVIENNTDLTAITDSTNNVTIEAIVYNHVAALDANPFHVTRSLEELKYSPTGHILRCTNKNCVESKAPGEKSVEITECCVLDEANKTVTGCDCPETCEGCTAYKEAVKNYYDENAKVPIIYQVKQTIANWYYIIRLLAVAAMLIVLIVVGIKMATASLAQDKAVYKKMLVDWVVGVIIIFSMHYIMIFTFYVSEQMVKLIEEVATSSYSVQMMQLAEKDSGNNAEGGGVEYDNQELEIKIYEAIRTRAYDAKLLDGMIGVIMYMTLVYFAFRYTIVYLKRFFSIVVLTLMAPALGVGYALQKVLTGRQEAFKNWLSQYVLNVLLQVVHALIYSIFISQALILSLESVAGMIIALILMNYALEADKIFRKIFKIQGGSVDEANNAAENLKSTIRDTAIGGKSAVKTLTNTPYTKAVVGVGKAVAFLPLAGIGLPVAKKAGQFLNKKDSKSDSLDESASSSSEGNPYLSGDELPNSSGADYDSGGDGDPGDSEDSGGAFGGNGASGGRSSTGKSGKSDKTLLRMGKKTLQGKLDNAKNKVMNAETDKEREAAMKEYFIALNDMKRYEKLTTPSTAKIFGAKLDRAIDIDNIFEYMPPKGTKGKIKAFFQLAKENASPLYHSIYGNRYKDPKTGKMVNDGTGALSKLKPSNFFGFTNEDKELLKRQMGLIGGTLGGMASLFLGMGTLVAHPKVGMGLLASGATLTHKGLGRSTHISTYKGKYTFSRFGFQTIKQMEKTALERAKKEREALKRQSIKARYKDKNKIIRGAVTLTFGATTLGWRVGKKLTTGTAKLVPKAISRTNIGQGFRDLDVHWEKQERAQEKEFKTETLNIISQETQARMSVLMDEKNEHFDYEEVEYAKKLYKSLGYEYDSKTGDLKAIVKPTTEEEKEQEKFENELMRKIKDSDSEDTSVYRNVKTSIHLTDTEVALIDREIDNILITMSAGKVLDMESEATLDEATRQLTSRLAIAGVIKDTQRAEIVFKAGREGLRTTLKEKADLANAKLEIAAKELEGVDKTNQEFIKQAIGEISKEKGITDFTQIKVEDVLERVNQRRTNPYMHSNQSEEETKSSEGSDESDRTRIKTKSTSIENEESHERKDDTEQNQEDIRTRRNREHNRDWQQRIVLNPLTEQEKQKFKTKILAYLATLETAKKVTHTTEFAKKREARVQVKDAVIKRKKKLRQILEMTFDTEEADPTSSLINQVNRIKKTGGTVQNSAGKTMQISSEESEKVLEMLFLRKQLEEVNDLAVEEVKIKKGSYRFQQATKAKAEARVDYLRDDLEIKKYAQENPEIFEDANFEARTDHYTTEQIEARKRIRDLQNGLRAKRRRVDLASRDLKMSGPIVDLNETRRRLLNGE